MISLSKSLSAQVLGSRALARGVCIVALPSAGTIEHCSRRYLFDRGGIALACSIAVALSTIHCNGDLATRPYPPAKVAFTVHPRDAAAGAPIAPAVQVTVQDAQGNTVTSSTASITVATATNPGGGTLSGTTTVCAVAGVATFSYLTIDKAGADYTLTAASGSLTGATSSSFTGSAGAASRVAFTATYRTEFAQRSWADWIFTRQPDDLTALL
jgi:hypothetical protein